MRTARNLVFLMAALACGCGGGLAGAGRLTGRGGVSASGGGGIDASCRRDFGTSAGAQKLEAFISAADGFTAAADDIQTTLLEACQQMGRELGMSAGELSGSGPEATRSVCNAVSERLRGELRAVRAHAGVTVTIRTRPPRCSVAVDAYAGCAAECDVNVDPGSVEIQCEGGELRGGCSAECTGSCAVDVSARCEGTCEGICEGTCSATAEDGSCAGSCSGDCRGQCVAQASGSCSGQCRGGCSVEFTEPRCTGTVRPPNVSADCQAACDARLSAEASCEPGEVEVAITGELGTDLAERAERVSAALRAGFGTILTIRARLERLRDSGEQVVRLAGGLPGAVASIGLEAAGCARGSIESLQSSMGSVRISMEVSVQVSGSVTAG